MLFERHRLTRRVIKDLKNRSTIGLAFYLILAYTIVFADDLYTRETFFSQIFLISITFICLFRYIQVLVSDRNEKYITGNYYPLFWVNVVLTSLIWGVAFSLVILNHDEPNRLLISLCCIGLCAGGVVAFIPDLKLAIVFNFAMLMPAAFYAFFKGGNYETALALMLLLFSIYLVLISIRGNKEYWDAYENEFLLKIKSKELERLSITDVLTNLYNRRYFDEMFEKDWKRGSRDKTYLTIIICDIDNFKKVNDTFGHLAGDKYLIETAGIIQNAFKRETDTVARYGGEEFVILLPGMKAEIAMEKAEEIRKKIEATEVHYNGAIIKTTISFGISSCIPNHNCESKAFLSKADDALYAAKEDGRNKIILIPMAP
jgi:diguanylate cyclase (GGDEF)-like protein